MGKSTAQSILTARSIPVIDTDALARALVEPGQPALGEIARAFGSDVLHPDGRMNRKMMAERVFSNEQSRKRLEEILHPRIRLNWESQAEAWRVEGERLGAVVIPLLFETNSAALFDATICVACSTSTQLERLRLRGWNEAQIQQRIASQWPIQRKMDASDFVIWTEGDLRLHEVQWDRILQSFELRKAGTDGQHQR